MKSFGIGLGVLLLIMALGWAIQGNRFFMYKVFAPAREQVRHDVFKESQSYNDGMAQELGNMQREYVTADEEGKAALRSLIRHRYSSYDTSRLPTHLQGFLRNIREGR